MIRGPRGIVSRNKLRVENLVRLSLYVNIFTRKVDKAYTIRKCTGTK
jgi:hypothetical protein